MTRFTKPVDFATKEFECRELKMQDDGVGGFTGYASTFGNFDSAKEAVVKGAFVGSLEYFKQHGFIALNHDWSGESIGYIEDAYEDEKGLVVSVKFHSTDNAQRVRTIMQERAAAGKSNRMSIGYKVLKSEPSAQGKLLKEIKLYEVSVVNVPANDQATVGNVKSEHGDPETEPLNNISNKTLELAAKALLLGDMAEADMLLSGLQDLSWRLQWKMWEKLADGNLTTDEKINLCQAMLMEFASIGIRAVETFLQDPNAVAVAEAKATQFTTEIKAGRTLSGANREAMKTWVSSLKTVTKEMDDLLLETRPPDSEKSEAAPALETKTQPHANQQRARVTALLHGV